MQREHPAGRHLEARAVEDLAADVGVQAEQLEARRGQHAAYGVEGVAAADREAELLVLVGGRDVLVRVGLDAGGHPDHDPGGRPEVGRDLREALDLRERVHDDPAHAEGDRPAQLGVGLVVAVQPDPRHREAGPLGDAQLSRGADVEAEALLGDPTGDRRAEERLAGVEHVVRRERVAEGARPRAQVLLVQDVRRGVELGHQVGDRDAADDEVAVDLARGARPQLRHQHVGVARLAQPRRPAQRPVGVRPARGVGGRHDGPTSARAR